MNTVSWIAIGLCLMQSAMFSGLNLAVFGVTRLRLEIGAASGSSDAARVLGLRRDPHFLLTTILWGNVAVNTLLAILANSALAGVSAFIFATVVITFIGEIFPQAYFSRHALRMASKLAPMLRFYQIVLYPVAKPSAKILDWWLGAEGIQYFRERDFREVIRRHVEADESDVGRFEGMGALNFLSLDDLPISQEGETIDPLSIISLPIENDRPVFPAFDPAPSDPFCQKVQASRKKWVVITDPDGAPQFILDADGFLREALFELGHLNPYDYCHRPLIVYDGQTQLGEIVWKLEVKPIHEADDVIDKDIILLWDESDRRVITGADILGRLLRGIVTRAAID
jgi:metal transporter CNNM